MMQLFELKQYIVIYKSFLISGVQMDQNQFIEALKSLDIIDLQKLPHLVSDIKASLDSYATDYNKLGHALYKLCEHIMRLKNVKDEYVEHFENLINQAIMISIKNQYRVGFDALRFVFNLNSQFYKTANCDIALNYPLGKERPIKRYNPAVGEQCDTVRPYVTSTSFCGWTRCKIVQIQDNNYTIKYLNSDTPNITRQEPFFAPLGTRMKDYEWRMGLDVGEPIQAYLNRVWYKATVAEVGFEQDCKKIRVTYRRFAENGDRQDSFGNKFFGLPSSEDEWMDVLSPRIQMCGKMADVKLCYYTLHSQQILMDDFYDTIFQQQYNQQQFFAIARTVNCKSLSLLSFINTFVKNRGIQTLMQVMDNPEINDEVVFSMMANIGVMVPFYPRMFVKRSPLYELYTKIFNYFKTVAKSLNPHKIDAGYFCYDSIGRRLFSLTEIHQDQNRLRKVLIKQFLKMNMEKKMLALRYLNDLMNPKKPYSEEQREEFNQFLKQERIFDEIFQSDTHQQIISRAGNLLQYAIQNEIISLREFENLWNIVPMSDLRGRATIEKLLSQASKRLPIAYVQLLIQKVLSLKETQLTIDNLNLLRQLKNREVANDYQIKILSFLWDILTVKSVNIKTNIEEQVQKVFKAFVSTIKDEKIRMNVLQSMCQKLQECKKVKNEIELLKDFIKSYPEKLQTLPSQLIQQNSENVPKTIYQAVKFLKENQIYHGVLNLLFKSKEQTAKRDLLNFISFLFQYDSEDINGTVKEIFQKLGPTVNFLEWVHKLLPRSLQFVVELLEKTTEFVVFQKINLTDFQAIKGMVVDVNAIQKNLKVITTYEYKNENKAFSSKNMDKADKGFETSEKQNKFIGPLLPQTKKHVYLLVSPFKLTGMKFLEHLLQVVKQSGVYLAIIKLIIQFISNLDDSIEFKTEEYRRQFLQQIIKQLKVIVEENKYNEAIKAKLQVYLDLFLEIFAETQKDGIGNLQPHFEKVEGEKLTLYIQNLFDKQKTKKEGKESIPKFTINCNENITLWRFKTMVGEIIGEKPENIDVIKFIEPMSGSNGKSLNQLTFYNKQNLKISRKPPKLILRSSLLNEDGTDIAPKFENILIKLFEQYKNPQFNGLGMAQMEKLSNERWKGSLFREKGRLDKMFQEFDKDTKGYLTYEEFKHFFYIKSVKNQNAVWKIINLSGYKNNFTSSTAQQEETNPINAAVLPRRILSCPQVFHLLFSILSNETFKELHLSFYKLLSLLEVDDRIIQEVESKIYEIIANQQSIYYLCYALEVTNSQLSKRSQFYLQFWKNNGIDAIIKRITETLPQNKSVYTLDPLLKDSIIPGFIKILNMYVSELLWQYKIVRFINQNRINYLELEDFVSRINQFKEPENDESYITENCKKLLKIKSAESSLKQIYNICSYLYIDILKNYNNQKTSYLQKLTAEVIRSIGSFVGSGTIAFNPDDFLFGIKNQSLSCRRSTVIIIYIYIFFSAKRTSEEIEKLLIKLLQGLPSQNKMENFNYFSLFNQIISKYMAISSGDNTKDQFFIDLANDLLDRLFSKVEGENRNALIADKIILGILQIIETLVKKDTICQALCPRKIEIMEKCLFAYNIEEKLNQLEITEIMLKTQTQAQHFKNYVMCKTEETRNLAYRIVARLHQLSANEDPDFINKYVLPIVKGICPQARLTSSKLMQVGLKNFGSTCYMNSMLQVLNSVGAFRNTLMKCQSQVPIIKELKRLFAALYFSERMDYSPKNLLTAFVPPINPGIQQDTTQFLNFLFDQLQSSLSSTKYKRLLDEIFKGANTVQMICHSCGFKKQNRQQFFSFGVQIENKFDLLTALEGTYQGQIITDYLCDACHQRVDMTKRNILSQIPSIMFIHLRRIVFNYDMFINMKIHTRLHFPEELNIEPYTKQGVQLREQLGLEYLKNLAHNQEQMKKFQDMTLHGKQKDFYKLKLKGIIVHSGSADIGHYYSILPDEKSWRKYDDSRVSIFTSSQFDKQCYGGTFTSEEWGSGSSVNAYVLVYEKIIKNPIKILPQKQSMQDETVIPYDDVKIYNSPQDYRELWLDNHNFMVESQLLSSREGKGFINFVSKLISDSPPEVNKVQLISEIVYKISIHSGIVGELINIFRTHANQVTPYIFYFYVISDKAVTFKLLFSNDKPLREFMASYLHIVLMQTFRKGDNTDREKVVGYILQLLNSLTGEVAKNWLRVDGYFKLFYSLVCSSTQVPELWRFFIQKNLISTLIDYVMEKQSPVRINPKNYSLGTKSSPMDFSFGVSIINFLSRHSYGFNGKNYEVPTIPQNFLFHLSDNDVICLSHMQFYRKMLGERQNLYELGMIIQRLCIMNLEFSRAIIDEALQTIFKITDEKDQMIDLSGVYLEILKIRDDFWINRAEMLIGVCLPYVMNNNLMSALNEDKYVFTSTLDDIFPVESLFGYVHLFRAKSSFAAFQLLRSIIQGCSVSDIAMKFIARQPSPSYLFSTLIEWVDDFLQKFTQKALKAESKHKQRLEGEIQNIKKYIQDIKDFISKSPQINYYKTVVTGEIYNKKEVESFNKEGIQLKVYQFTTYCTKSEAFFGQNKRIEKYLQAYKLTKNVSPNSNILKFFKKTGKAIALKLAPVQQDEDKQLVSLFDENPNPPYGMVDSFAQINQTQPVTAPDEGEAIVQSQPIRSQKPTQLAKPIEKEKISEQNKQKVQEMQEQVNLQDVFQCNYFRQIEVSNRFKERKVVRLTFSLEDNPNFIAPQEFIWQILPKSSESLWIAKQDYSKDWGKLDITMHVEDYVKEKHKKENITSWWFKTYGENREPAQDQMKMQIQKPAEQNIPEPAQNTNNNLVGASQDFIECQICTLLNPASNSTCDACFSNLK